MPCHGQKNFLLSVMIATTTDDIQVWCFNVSTSNLRRVY